MQGRAGDEGGAYVVSQYNLIFGKQKNSNLIICSCDIFLRISSFQSVSQIYSKTSLYTDWLPRLRGRMHLT